MYFWLTSSSYPRTRAFVAAIRDVIFTTRSDHEILETVKSLLHEVAELRAQVAELKADIAAIEPDSSFMKVKLF
jgi:uncharacterized protein YhaN